MSFVCKVCGTVYSDKLSLAKGGHSVNDVYGDTRIEKCVAVVRHLLPDGRAITESTESSGDVVINAFVPQRQLAPIECDLDNVGYLYDDKYYGQFMRPGVQTNPPCWRDVGDADGLLLRYAHDVPCINSEESRYRHAYNRAYLGVRPEAVRIASVGCDALITMTHWAYVDGLFSAGEVQVWIGERGHGIDPRKDLPAIVIYGESEGDKFGIDVRSAGDLDGDGHDELLISAPFHRTRRDDGTFNDAGGVVYLLFLGKLDLTDAPLRISASEIGQKYPGIRFEGGHDGSRYIGWGLTLDRARFASTECGSIVIGSFDIYPWKRRSDGRSAPAFSPRVYVIHGSRQVPARLSRFRLGLDNECFGMRVTTIDLSELPLTVGGMNLTTLGISDVDNDGFDELAITVSDGTSAGASYVYYGGAARGCEYRLGLGDADLVVRTQQKMQLSDDSSLEFRGIFSATTVEDFDGDGSREILFVAPKTVYRERGIARQVGCVGLLRGGERRLGSLEFSDLDFIVHGEVGRTYALGKQNSCRSVDITGNGCADLLINDTAYPEDCCGRTIERGRFWLVEGGRDRPRVMAVPKDAKVAYLADLRVPGLFGYGWTVGDFNGDGRYEIAIGDHYLGYRDGKRAVGGVYLFPSEAVQAEGSRDSGTTSSSAVYMLSGTSSDVNGDAVKLGLVSNHYQPLVLDTRTQYSPEQGAVDFLSFLATRETKRDERYYKGSSLSRYGTLVEFALGSLTSGDETSSAASGVARWILEYASGAGKHSNVLSKKEFLYFLCSSSQRSRLLTHIVRDMCGDSPVRCMVDHGAGIGMLALCTKESQQVELRQVECSEIDVKYVEQGLALWSAAGQSAAIHYQNCSAVDFVYPENVSVVFFGQMFFRIPRDRRQSLLDAAWVALEPGGLLIVNELMNRQDANASQDLLSSNELISYLPVTADKRVYTGVNAPTKLTLDEANDEVFRNSDNFVVARKPVWPSCRVLSLTTLSHEKIVTGASQSDLAYLNKTSNMDVFKETFIDYILKKRTDLCLGQGTLLDSGCGNGRFCEALAKYYRVTGEDISPGAIYMAQISSETKRELNIQYRLASSLDLNDIFDVVFLRGPSFLEGNQVSSLEFQSALQHMVNRCRCQLVYVSWSPEPFNVKNRFGCWSHDPEAIRAEFSRYGQVAVSYQDSYVVAVLVPHVDAHLN